MKPLEGYLWLSHPMRSHKEGDSRWRAKQTDDISEQVKTGLEVKGADQLMLTAP